MKKRIVVALMIFSTKLVAAVPEPSSQPDALAGRPDTRPSTTTSQPLSASLNRDEILLPFRDWWYRGGMRPNGDYPVAKALLAFHSQHPDDAEVTWWVFLLQQAGQVVSGTPTGKLLSEAAQSKFAPAMTSLGASLVEHPTEPADAERGLKLVSDAYAMGDADAAITLGTFAADGRAGFEKDLKSAETYLHEGINRGTMRAHWALTEVLARSGRVSAAFDQLKLGANAGDARCMERLAITYRDAQLGQPTDPVQAVMWMKAGSEYGSARMQREIAKALATGYGGVVVNLSEARRAIELAANAGDREARFMLAEGYLAGRYGYTANAAKSGDLLGQLIDEHYPPAEYTMARAYFEGVIRSKTLTDDQTRAGANDLMKRAAQAGYPPAVEYLKAHTPTSQPT